MFRRGREARRPGIATRLPHSHRRRGRIDRVPVSGVEALTIALAEQARAGALKATTLVWKAGMSSWTAAQDVPEVAAVLGAVPPPLPPS